MNKFIWQDGEEVVEMTVGGNPSLDELIEAFTRFLQAQGYQKPSPFSNLDFVDIDEWKAQ